MNCYLNISHFQADIVSFFLMNVALKQDERRDVLSGVPVRLYGSGVRLFRRCARQDDLVVELFDGRVSLSDGLNRL
jgi:hypothetical protein